MRNSSGFGKNRTSHMVELFRTCFKLSRAVESYQPYLTTYCAVLLDRVAQDPRAQSNQVLYPLREFKQQIEAQLSEVQAHGKTWIELLSWENREGANLSPHTEDIVTDGPLKPSAKSELKLGKVLGRLDLLEEDLVEFNPGSVSYARQIKGTDEIREFLDSVEQGTKSIEESLRPEFDSKFKYWNGKRTDDALRVAVSSFMGVAIPVLVFSSFSVQDILHNPIMAGNVFAPYIFRKAFPRALDYLVALVTKGGKNDEDNKWYYRATQFVEKNKIVRRLLEHPEKNASVYYGFGIPVTNELADSMVREEDTPTRQEKIFNSIQQHRTSFEEEDIRWAFLDFIFYFEPATNSPILIVANRIKKTFVVPAPKKKEQKKGAAAIREQLEWSSRRSANQELKPIVC